MRIEDSIQISAPIERLWELTIDVEAWPTFTPTMTKVQLLGPMPLRIGTSARVKQPGQRAKVWTVTALEPGRIFAWSTRSLGTTMTGCHELTEVDAGTTNTLRVDIEGALAPLVGRLLRRPIRKAIAAENQGFKAAAEL